MFQCNEHVEMNKFFTLITIIESQFYIIDSLSEIFHWNEMLNWWLPGCNDVQMRETYKYETCVILHQIGIFVVFTHVR